MNTFQLIKKYQAPRLPMQKSEEMKTNMTYFNLILGSESFLYLQNAQSSYFNLIRANVVLLGLNNKKIIENVYKENADKTRKELIKLIDNALKDAPYFEINGEKIYIPCFSKTINKIYLSQPDKLGFFPYNELENNYEELIIDPFDTYGVKLFESSFSTLIKISENDGITAYYHKESQNVFFVNSQARLDDELPLFDKFIKKPEEENMIYRINNIIPFYFKDDLKDFLKAMHDNHFLSLKALKKIVKGAGYDI